ncbi:hypothetical protein COO60DRAFT_1126119 [Scenedesmus sp. NREL 46B-D3]|nr:hypothetical protein COO60DRAFT_1126119 [Scenedesmus sp. NREL 46B-D3]
MTLVLGATESSGSIAYALWTGKYSMDTLGTLPSITALRASLQCCCYNTALQTAAACCTPTKRCVHLLQHACACSSTRRSQHMDQNMQARPLRRSHTATVDGSQCTAHTRQLCMYAVLCLHTRQLPARHAAAAAPSDLPYNCIAAHMPMLCVRCRRHRRSTLHQTNPRPLLPYVQAYRMPLGSCHTFTGAHAQCMPKSCMNNSPAALAQSSL